MGGGRKAGTALALGVAAGSMCWGMLALAGLTTVLAAYASILTVVKIIGGLYLLWLAFKAFRSAATAGDIRTISLTADGGRIAFFRRGLAIQMTNPKAALTWIAIMSLGVQPGSPLWVGVSIVLGASVLSVAGHLTYAVAFSTRPMVTAYKKARRWIEMTLGAFFCFAGIKLLASRV